MRWIVSRLRFGATAAVVTLMIAAVSIGVRPSVASAHAALLSVDPANGSVVAESPLQVVLTFSEHVSFTGGDVRVLDDEARQVSGEASSVGEAVIVPLPADLGNGTFTVSYQVISADSHRIAGATVFHVGAPSLDAPVDGADSSAGVSVPLTVAATVAGFAGYVLVMGAVGMWWMIRFVVTRQRTRVAAEAFPVAEVDRLAARAAGLAIVVLVAWAPIRIARTLGGVGALSGNGVLWDEIRGPIGMASIVSAVGLLVMLVARWRSPAGWQRFVSPAAGFVALAGFAVEGHTRSQQPRLPMVGFDLVHLTAGSVWLGGVVALIVGFRSAADRISDWSSVVSRFSSVASALVVSISLAGLGMAWIVLPNWSAVTATEYGRTLVVKLVFVALTLALAAYNRWVLVPHVGGGHEAVVSRFGRVLLAELVVLGAVFGTTALLVTRSPVASVTDDSRPIAATHAMLSSGGHATIVFAPGTVGSNSVRLELLEASGAPLVPVEPPAFEIVEPDSGIGPLRPAAEPIEVDDGVYDIQIDVPIAGTWEVHVDVRTGEFDVSSGITSLTIDAITG